MSVDYYSCRCCDESLYSEYVASCSNCGKNICSDCLINVPSELKKEYGVYAYNYGIRYDGTEEQKKKWGLSDKYAYEIYAYEIGELIDDTGVDSKYCPFCSGEEVHDSELLELALQKLHLTKEHMKQEILTKRKEDK